MPEQAPQRRIKTVCYPSVALAVVVP
jgi:hypothetical protein